MATKSPLSARRDAVVTQWYSLSQRSFYASRIWLRLRRAEDIEVPSVSGQKAPFCRGLRNLVSDTRLAISASPCRGHGPSLRPVDGARGA